MTIDAEAATFPCSFHFDLVNPSAPPRRRTMTREIRRILAKDRAWFAKHPRRTVRLRKPAPGEIEAMGEGLELEPSHEGYPLVVAVIQVEPGVRTRRPLYCGLPSDAHEAVILAFIRLAEDGMRQGYAGEITARDIRRAMGLDTGPLN